MRTDGKTKCLNQSEPHSHTTRAKRKPAKTQCFRRFCGRGRRTWSRLLPRVLLPGGERPAPTEAGAETGAAERHRWPAPLGTRFWSGCGNSAQRAGEGQGCAVLPAKSQNGRCWFGAVRKNEWIERASAICHRMIASICDLYYNITKQDRLAYVERISCELLLRILRALPMFQRME